MNVNAVIRSQFRAALAMLRQAVETCPENLWNDPADQNRFWQIAYHVLFYTHLYLQKTVEEFKPWSKHKEKIEAFQPRPAGTGEDAPENTAAVEPYSRDEVLEYLDLCLQEIDRQTAQLDPEAASGFFWLPFSKLELQIYSIRHLQQHTGELMERLGSRANVDVNWVGTKPD